MIFIDHIGDQEHRIGAKNFCLNDLIRIKVEVQSCVS